MDGQSEKKRKNKKSAKRSSTSEVEKAAKESDAKPQVEGTQLAKTTTLDDDDSKSTQDSTSVVRALDSLVNNELASDLARKIQMLQASTSAAKDLTDAKQHNYEFWKTQPVPSFDEKATENTYIHPPLEVDQVRKDPYSLPEPFAWADVDVNSNAELDELYTLLTENYVEDDDNMFRFDYSREFLRWALMSPGWQKTWHCGIRAGNSSGKLLAFIAAVPAVIRIYDKTVRMVEINFLCVHKKLRSKRVAPVLIREITRRVNLHEIFQATFTAGIVIPKPVGMCRYWHRSLNPKKLVETSFSHLSRNMTMQRTIKLHKLPDQPQLFGIRTLEKRHVSTAYKLLNNYLAKFDMAPDFREDEFEHFFVPRDNVVYSYVIEDKSGKVTDLLSFYCLPSSVMHHPLHKSIKAAYSFYNVATSTSIIQLMNDALIIAKNEGFDVFNALDLMDNKDFLEKLKFGIGDGNLQYYLYNWKCPDLTPERIGLVLQ